MKDRDDTKKKISRNELHMKYVQESRRSNESGYHSLKKKKRNSQQERKKVKQNLKELINVCDIEIDNDILEEIEDLE